MIYLFILSLVGVLCAAENEPGFLKEPSSEVRRLMPESPHRVSACIDQTEPHLINEALKVATCVGMVGVAAVTVYTCGVSSGVLTSIWLGSLLYLAYSS